MEAVKVASLGQISRRPLRGRAASTGGTCSVRRRVGMSPSRARASSRLVPSITELLCDLGLADAARRAHRLLHPSRGRRCGRSRRSAGRRTSSSTGSASSRRRTSSSTSTRTAGGRRGARRVRPAASSSPTRWRRATTSTSTGCSAAIFDREARGRAAVRRVRGAPTRELDGRRAPRRRPLPDLARPLDDGLARHVHLPHAGARSAGDVHASSLSPEATRTSRYPEVDLAELAGSVDRVLLSSEPYHFKRAAPRRGRGARPRRRGLADRRRDDLLVRLAGDRRARLPRGVHEVSVRRPLLERRQGLALALWTMREELGIEPAALLTTITEDYDRVSMHARAPRAARAPGGRGRPAARRGPASRRPAPNEIYEERMAAALVAPPLAEASTTFAFGDLFLEDIRAYREERLRGGRPAARSSRSGAATPPSSPASFIDAGFEATLVCVDPTPARRRPSPAAPSTPTLLARPARASVDPCGENGEFHTFVTAGPIFSAAGPGRARRDRRARRLRLPRPPPGGTTPTGALIRR